MKIRKSKRLNKRSIFMIVEAAVLAVVSLTAVYFIGKNAVNFYYQSKADDRTASLYRSVREYQSNGITVRHHPDDQSVYFQTPSNEIAYNVRRFIHNNEFFTIYHGEPRDKSPQISSGDSVKLARTSNKDLQHTMPSARSFIMWGNKIDAVSPMFSADNNNLGLSVVSGAANPMIVGGMSWLNDSYKFIYYLTVIDDTGDRYSQINQVAQKDFRHYLHQMRTTDFSSYDLLVDDGGKPKWVAFSEAAYRADPTKFRAYKLKDKSGKLIRSNAPRSDGATQGLIGSMVLVNKKYYYFYTDHISSASSEFGLFVRTTDRAGYYDQNEEAWSTPIRIMPDRTFPEGTIYRVAYDDRLKQWVFATIAGNTLGRPDLCIEYVQPTADVSKLRLSASPDKCLHVKGSAHPNPLWMQHELLTDINGHITIPVGADAAAYGGEVTWTDFTPDTSAPVKVWGAPVWRAGWTIQSPLLATPAPTPIQTPKPTPTPMPPSISSPTNLQPSGSISAGVRTISWNGIPSTNTYLIRIDAKDTPWSPTACDGKVDGNGDLCHNSVSGTSLSFDFKPGRSYRIWVHASVNGQATGTAETSVDVQQLGAVPTNLKPAGTISPGVRNITWTPSLNANAYALRVDDLTTTWNPICDGEVHNGDLCHNSVSGTSLSFDFKPGRSYRIWVHGMVNGSSGNAASSTVVVSN